MPHHDRPCRAWARPRRPTRLAAATGDAGQDATYARTRAWDRGRPHPEGGSVLRHFSVLDAAQQAELFERPPDRFDLASERRTLATALGATLYTPGTRRDYAARLPALMRQGLVSAVLCLEDAISDADLEAGEDNVVELVRRIHGEAEEAPLLFVRVRSAGQIYDLAERIGAAMPALAGFVLPKFTAASGPGYLDAVQAVGGLAMPVLETEEIVYAETRVPALLAARDLLDAYADRVLAVRVGATDLCGLFGLRRSPDLTVYDIAVVRDVIAAIVNVFVRGDDGFVVTGPVWEYFGDSERMLKPQLRTAPFVDRDASALRERLIRQDLDGLLREVLLDRANGLCGKTVIHPSHLAAVHSLYAVTGEEWVDAQAVQGSVGGATGSGHGMVEAKPHARWAEGVLRRASVFGVLRPEKTFVDLLDSTA